jgi:hypothetical protein
MKKLFILFLTLSLFGCKSQKKSVVNDITLTTEQKESSSLEKGITLTGTEFIFSSEDLEITRYEPISFQIAGRDTVILKQVVYRQSRNNERRVEQTKVDTTKVKELVINNTEVIDKSTEDKEFKGLDFVKSIVQGIFGSVFGAALKYFWIIGIFIGLLTINILRRLFKKTNKTRQTK